MSVQVVCLSCGEVTQMSALVVVTPCGAADSLFRSTSDDVHALVRGWCRADQNTTSVGTADGTPEGPTFHMRYGGQREVNDSTRLELARAQLGASRGGPSKSR